MIPLLSQAAMRGPPAGAGGDDVREVHVARFHVVEFQKRGLPHAHLLLWLDDAREARDDDLSIGTRARPIDREDTAHGQRHYPL